MVALLTSKIATDNGLKIFAFRLPGGAVTTKRFPFIGRFKAQLFLMLGFSNPLSSRKEQHMSKTGTVKFFNTDKGYGFIQPDDGSDDSFVHISAVQAAGMRSLDKDQRLNYEVETGRNGKASAVNLSAAD